MVQEPNRPAASDQFFDSFFDIERKFDNDRESLEIVHSFADWEIRSFIRVSLLDVNHERLDTNMIIIAFHYDAFSYGTFINPACIAHQPAVD
jgi:hypothetical protein